jgi:hypothetical protein
MHTRRASLTRGDGGFTTNPRVGGLIEASNTLYWWPTTRPAPLSNPPPRAPRFTSLRSTQPLQTSTFLSFATTRGIRSGLVRDEGDRFGKPGRSRNKVRYTSHRWALAICVGGAWVGISWIGNKPKFRQVITIASCNPSCAASAAHLQAGAAKRCELGAAKCTHVRRIPAPSLGGDVNFRLRQAVRAQFKGGSILLCLLD